MVYPHLVFHETFSIKVFALEKNRLWELELQERPLWLFFFLINRRSPESMPCPHKPAPFFHSEDWVTEWDRRSVIAHQLPGHHERILFLYTISTYQDHVQNKVLHNSPMALLIQRRAAEWHPASLQTEVSFCFLGLFLTLSFKKGLFLCVWVIYTFIQ